MKNLEKASEIMLARGGINLLDVKQVLRECPDEFKKTGPWTRFAAKLMIIGLDSSNWKWKISSEERYKWIIKLVYLRGSPNFTIEDKMYIGGWMLSEMLSEVPNLPNLVEKK
jgi:hypothetical protein